MKELGGCSLKKNDLFEMEIEDLGNEGEGIGRLEGFTFFVKDALPGDVIRARVIKLKKNYGFARLEEIIIPSDDRVEPRCPVARPCGGCQLQHMSYPRQLEYKQQKVRSCLERIAGIQNPVLEPIQGMDEPYYYRNKAQFPVGTGKDGQLAIGFYAGHTHSIIDSTHCYIQARVNEYLTAAVREYLTECQIPVYDEESHRGLVRHILTRVGFSTGEIMVCLVINGTRLPKSDQLLKKLQSGIEQYNRITKEELSADSELIKPANAFYSEVKVTGGFAEGITEGQKASLSEGTAEGERQQEVTFQLQCFCLNINRERTNVILGTEIVPIYGEPYITDYIGEVKYQISPLSFYQVNPVQTKRLYQQALEYADISGNEIVWDLYCGIGTLSLFLARKARQVYGVEIVPQAIEDARKNAAINEITNAEFFVGAAEDVLPAQYEKSGGTMRADIIVVDPPRKGCEESLLETVVAMEPEKVIYVSCDPATLARDVKYLKGKGYEFVKARAFDQFGQSGHVESVCLMSRVDK